MLTHFQFCILTNSFSQLSIFFFLKDQNLENLFRWWKTWTETSKFMKMSSFWLFWKCTLNTNIIFWIHEKTLSFTNSYCDLIWQRFLICLRNSGFFMLFSKIFRFSFLIQNLFLSNARRQFFNLWLSSQFLHI